MSGIKLKTEIKVVENERLLGPDAVVAGIGSCFAQDMLDRLFERGFKGMSNPNGIVYNAVSIRESLDKAADGGLYGESDFFEHDGKWHSWAHHGAFSDKSLDCAVEKANENLTAFRAFTKEAGLFVLTPSSSVVYELLEDSRIVANCHKVPSARFRRRLLSVEENHSALSGAIEAVRKLNPDCLILITLSPVRHYPGDLVLNARSKAQVLSAIGLCLDEFNFLTYFPSYEILLDELRDYRFYKDDMLHPTELARSIIFERFIDAHFDKAAKDKIAKEEKKLKALGHIVK